MGSAISSVTSGIKSNDEEHDKLVKEHLRQCEETAKFVSNGFRLQVQERYKNPGEFTKWQVVGGRQDREDSFIGVATSTTPATAITDGVGSLVKGLFNTDPKSKDGKAFSESVTNLANVVLNVFLGNASGGSSEHSTFFIIPHGFALYRVDVLMYKYTFSSEGFTKHFTSQTVVYASRGLLSAAKDLSPEELISYLSVMMDGDPKKMKHWMDSFSYLYKTAQAIHDHNPPASSPLTITPPNIPVTSDLVAHQPPVEIDDTISSPETK